MNQEKITELIQFLTKNPGYQKWGAEKLACKLDSTVEEIAYARKVLRNDIFSEIKDNEPDNSNTSEIKEFTEHLTKLGISEEDVKSVKFWQTQKGDIRYSIVTKNDKLELPTIESIKEELTKDLKPAALPEVGDYVNSTLVVFLSDKHIGAMTKEGALYDNPYCEEEVQNRMIKVVSEIHQLYIKNEIPFERIVLIDLGDAMDGYNALTTRGGHTLPQNMTNKEAFEVFVRLHKAFYNAILLSGFAKSYEIYHVTNSNHGGEFEHFSTRCLQEYLKCKYPEVAFEILDKFITPVSISNHTYLLSHGKDTEDMKNGLPLCLDAKTENYIKDYILEKGISTKNLHFVKGDLHQASTQWGKHFRYRNVPSMYGSSKWIMTNFGLTKPGCSFDLIEGDNIKQWELWF